MILDQRTLQTRSFTATNGNTYSYKITSIDTAGNTSLSNCSGSLTINTTPPSNATSLGWQQTSPTNTLSVTASWTKSSAGTLADQTIQFYSDGSCMTPQGSAVDLSSSSIQTRVFSGTNGGTYSYKITSIDTATNTSTSSCSSGLSINTTPPASATGLSWVQSNPTNSASPVATWTVSSSPVLSDQKIQFFSDGVCGTQSGSLIDLSSSTTHTQSFSASNGGTYS